jgi:DNA repair exonuclease SbcCD ATPase subunit
MILKTLKAKNFYSFRTVELDLSKFRNIVYVKGINRDSGGSNGSGKSSILEMITFAIFGKTIRKSTEEALVNCDSKKNLEVEICVYKDGVGEAVITRAKRPNSLQFYLDGVDLTQENANKTQEKIEKELGLSYKTFVASIVFGQHVDLEFLSATADDKRTIIRNFLNLDEIFNWRDKIRDLKSQYRTEAEKSSTVISELEKQSDKIKSKFIKETKDIKLEPLEEVKKRQNLILNHREQLIFLKNEIESKDILVRSIQEKINKGVYCIQDKCKTCKKTYTKKQTEANIRGLTRKLNPVLKATTKLRNKINTLEANIKKLSSMVNLEQWIKLKEQQDLFLSQKKLEEQYNEILLRRTNEEEVKKSNELNYEVMRFWERAFSEQGIIKYFIRNILDYLNFKTNEYLSILTNNQFSISFNEELEETIINNGRKLSFMSLSGGEKRKINLAVMLSLQSLLTHTSKEQSNIIFFDEIAENMDEDGCQGIHNLLKSLKEEDKTVFLITHNSHLKSLLDGCQILTIEKRNGESRII